MLVFEKLSQALASAYKWDVGIAGTYMRLSSCQWPVTVILYKGGQVIGQMQNMLAGDYVEGIAFDAISILNGATAQAVDVQISGGGAGSNRVLGEVAVIDGGRARVLAGLAFIGYAYAAPVVGNLSHVQLWNPGASGKNLVVEQVSTFTQGAGLSGFAGLGANVALTGLIGSPPSKKVGGAASAVAQLRSQANAAILGLLPSMFNMTIQGPLFKPNEPIIVPPGFGLNIVNGADNQDLGAHFEYFEEAI